MKRQGVQKQDGQGAKVQATCRPRKRMTLTVGRPQRPWIAGVGTRSVSCRKGRKTLGEASSICATLHVWARMGALLRSLVENKATTFAHPAEGRPRASTLANQRWAVFCVPMLACECPLRPPLARDAVHAGGLDDSRCVAQSSGTE